MAIPSSFGAVQFYTRAVSESGFNKQAVVHEIVNGVGAYVEVLGQGIETYQFDAFVDNMYSLYLDRDMLRAMIMDEGIAELLHPSLGLKKCWCSNVVMSEDARQLGIINLQLTFVVAENDYYTMTTNNSSLLSSITSRASNYLTSMDVSGLGTSAMALVSGGETIMRSVSGLDPALNTFGSTLGRFYQAGSMGTALLNTVTATQSTATVIPAVVSQRSAITSQLT